jgi:hypothetical protein
MVDLGLGIAAIGARDPHQKGCQRQAGVGFRQAGRLGGQKAAEKRVDHGQTIGIDAPQRQRSGQADTAL